MKEIRARVRNQILQVDQCNIRVAGSVNIYKLVIGYDEEWDEIENKIVTFSAQDGSIYTVLDNPEGVVIPSEVFSFPGALFIGVLGMTGDDVVITTASPNECNRIQVLHATTRQKQLLPITPETPGILQQILAKIGDLGILSTEAKENLVGAINEVHQKAIDAMDAAEGAVEKAEKAEEKATEALEKASGYKTDIENLQTEMATEKETRETTDAELQKAITDETTNRENADNSLQEQIDAITASADVKDIVATYQDLLAYDTSTLGDNDIIKVLSDTTHQDAQSYYRWDIETHQFSYIGQEGPFLTPGQAANTYVPKTRTVNGKALDENIELDAEDVGAATKEDLDALKLVIRAAENMTVSGYSVPKLTAENVTDAYNAAVAGKMVVITDATGNNHYDVNQADTDGENLYITILYYTTMFATYQLDINDSVTVAAQLIPLVKNELGQDETAAISQKLFTDMVGNVEEMLAALNNGEGI